MTGGLTPRQANAAALLAAGRELKITAREVGVSERSVHAWKGEPVFRAYVAGLRDEMLSQAVGRLAERATQAIETMVGLLDSADEGIRLRASVAVMDTLLRAREHTELAGRVAELEALAAPPSPNGVHA